MSDVRLVKTSGEKIVIRPRERIEEKNEGAFDRHCFQTWTDIHRKPDVFRYFFTAAAERTEIGTHKFLLQFNEDRHTLRRKPQAYHSIAQQFDPDQFHFLKASPEELMFTFQTADDDKTKHQFLVNVSPIDKYHSLFCPHIDERLPQIITRSSLELACFVMFLADSGNIRVGFNSLGGMASVNHLHYHLIHVDFRLPIETMKCRHIKGPLYESIDYPAKCFCFELKLRKNIGTVCADIIKIIDLLMVLNVAHNLFITRGEGLDDPGSEALRICLWVRTPSHVPKELTGVNLAICEFSGHILVKSRQDYDSLTYDRIARQLEETTFEPFERVRSDVVSLFD